MQAYVGHLPTDVDTPPRQLAGFDGARLRAGRDGQVTLTIKRRSVSYDEARHRCSAVAGRRAGAAAGPGRSRGAGVRATGQQTGAHVDA
ncbi:fibronectin type III-like domain-contianing protein [Streptomyces sp. NPDC056704]|uniref:fibronectin type III-like domain-contianing protein n=1 Tax=Streptomyces sp. NPDC056704 TaxID=3345917 RepID=UPI0036BE691E